MDMEKLKKMQQSVRIGELDFVYSSGNLGALPGIGALRDDWEVVKSSSS